MKNTLQSFIIYSLTAFWFITYVSILVSFSDVLYYFVLDILPKPTYSYYRGKFSIHIIIHLFLKIVPFHFYINCCVSGTQTKVCDHVVMHIIDPARVFETSVFFNPMAP